MSEILRGLRISQKDDTVTFYTTANGEKRTHTLPASFIFASERGDYKIIDQLTEDVYNSLGYAGKIVESGSKSILTLHITGDTEIKNQLSTHWHKFFKNALSTSGPEKLAMQYPVYSLLEFNGTNEMPKVSAGAITLAEMLGNYCAIDIEKKAKGNDIYGETAMCSLVSPFKKELFVLEENAPESLEGVLIHPVKDEKEITRAITKALKLYNTVFIHNAPFDVKELRETKTKKSEKLLTGSDGIEPHVRGHGFVKRVWHPEIDFVDTCKASQYSTPNASDTLDDYSRFWGTPLKKTLSHDDLEQRINNPTPENNKIVGEYCLLDSEMALKNGEKTAEAFGPVAIYFGRALGHIVAVSQLKLAQQRRTVEYWNVLKAYRKLPSLRIKKQVSTKFGPQEIESDFIYVNERMKLLKEHIKIVPRRGILNNVAVLYPIIMQPRGLKDVENLEKTLLEGDPRARTIRAEFLDALCVEQLYDLCIKDKYFDLRYDTSLEFARDKITSRIKKLAETLEKSRITPVNMGQRFLYLKKEELRSVESFGGQLNLEEFGILYGTADHAISMGPNRIVWRLNNVLFSEGVDIKGRHGLRSDFERNTITNLITDAFDCGAEKARALYKEKLVNVAKGNISDRELAFEITRHKEYISIQAEDSLRQQIIRDLNMKVGETALAVYGSDSKWHRLGECAPNYKFYLNRFIGANPKSANEGTVSRFDIAINSFDVRNYNEIWAAAGYNCIVF